MANSVDLFFFFCGCVCVCVFVCVCVDTPPGCQMHLIDFLGKYGKELQNIFSFSGKYSYQLLTLKQPITTIVVCLVICFIFANSVDPDQTAPLGAV